MSGQYGPKSIIRSIKEKLEADQIFGLSQVPVLKREKKPGSEGTSSVQKPEAAEKLKSLEREVIACKKCPLFKTRTKHVFGEGSPDADLMLVGEAPGREEDLQGRPFVGMAGQLLTKMIEAIGLKREKVYICNILKDRPPNNRVPEPQEVAECFSFLQRQIAIIKPKVICALGATPSKALIGPGVSITKARGGLYYYENIPLVPTFHPAYLLRNPPAKKLVWIDLKKVKKIIEEKKA